MPDPSPEPWRLGHRTGLDGLRGVAILLVLVGHSLPTGMASATVGVSMFFVLSGFLITSLLWEERLARGRIRLFRFYARRIRRLIPAFALVLFATLAAMALVGRGPEGAFDGLAAASYVGNFVMADGQWLGPLSHTWSLAIEEQFYIAWPLLLLVGMRALRPIVLAGLLVGCAIAIQVARPAALIAGISDDRVSFATQFQADGLLLGCALAIVLHTRPLRMPILAGPVALAILLAVEFVLPAPLYPAIGGSVAVLAATLLVATVATKTPGRDPIFENPWLRRVGLISYGLYLWHYPVMWLLGFFDQRPHPGLAALVIGIAVTVVAAVTSYLLVERRFLATSRNRVDDDARRRATTLAVRAPAAAR